MHGLTQHNIWALSLSLGILLTLARVLGEFGQRFGQPAVLGEILADIAHACMRPAFVERATALAGYIEFLALLRTSDGEAS